VLLLGDMVWDPPCAVNYMCDFSHSQKSIAPSCRGGHVSGTIYQCHTAASSPFLPVKQHTISRAVLCGADSTVCPCLALLCSPWCTAKPASAYRRALGSSFFLEGRTTIHNGSSTH